MKLKRQLRGFVLLWTVITILMGACTFFAIFWVLGETGFGASSQRNFALPTNLPTQPQQVAVLPTIEPTQAPPPTVEPTPVPPTVEPTTETASAVSAQSVAQAASPQPLEPTPAPPTPTPLPASNTAFQPGIQVQYSLDENPDNQDMWMREVKDKMGLNWFKQQVRWEDIEKEKGVFDWSKLDLVMPSKNKFDLNIMMSIVTAPNWAREQGVNLEKHGPPANIADYINFITQIMNRYPGQIQAIEIWNEQNLDREWTSTEGLSAKNYVDMAREVTKAIKAIDPGVIVISGALAPTGGWTEPDGRISAIDDYVYLQAMFDSGLLDFIDCVGVHHNGYNIGPSVPYDNVPPDPSAQFRGPFDNAHHSWSFYSTLNTYAKMIGAEGKQQKLCITEFGWATTEDLTGFPRGFEFANDNTLQEQADYIIEALDLMDEWGFVWLAFIWNFNYAPQAGWDPSNDNVPYSIIGPNWSFRPAYDAIIAWSRERREGGS